MFPVISHQPATIGTAIIIEHSTMLATNRPLPVRLMGIWQQGLWLTFDIWLGCYCAISLSGIHGMMDLGLFVLKRILPLLLNSPVCWLCRIVCLVLGRRI